MRFKLTITVGKGKQAKSFKSVDRAIKYAEKLRRLKLARRAA